MIEFPSPTLIGVVHLAPLPGSPRHMFGMDEIVERALQDAGALKQAGFDAAIIENFGDAPFAPGSLPPVSVAAMAIVADLVRRKTGLIVGINALRNDARSALGLAVATGAKFIRVNVHTGVQATDQGLVEGKVHETLRERKLLAARVAILADVHVKHATPISEPNIARAAKETAYRGLADGLIVTGPATGEPTDLSDLRKVREAVPDRRLFVGSGATVESIRELLTVATGVIVGTSIKEDGDAERPIDPQRAKDFARATGRG